MTTATISTSAPNVDASRCRRCIEVSKRNPWDIDAESDRGVEDLIGPVTAVDSRCSSRRADGTYFLCSLPRGDEQARLTAASPMP